MIANSVSVGIESSLEHTGIIQKLKELNFKNVILVGPEFQKVAKESDFLCFNNNNEALDYLKANPVQGSLILLKGSRGIALEVLLEAL